MSRAIDLIFFSLRWLIVMCMFVVIVAATLLSISGNGIRVEDVFKPKQPINFSMEASNLLPAARTGKVTAKNSSASRPTGYHNGD